MLRAVKPKWKLVQCLCNYLMWSEINVGSNLPVILHVSCDAFIELAISVVSVAFVETTGFICDDMTCILITKACKGH